MTQPLVAIVVPVYNSAEHLRECLESLLAQTYSNWHAVVMDNCSTDGTGAIADEFARRDKRLRVVHCEKFVIKQENYNRAVAEADPEAEYIKVLEADNWITPDCLDRTVRLAQRDATIGIVNSYWLWGRRPGGSGLSYAEQIIAGGDVARGYFLDGSYLFGVPTSLLFRAKALRDESVWFRSDVCSDDVDLCLRLLRKWNFGFVHQILAFWRVDDTGAFSKVQDFDFNPAYRYFAIRAYGEDFFAGRELEEVRRAWKRQYFDRLGHALVVGRSRAYWEFHRGMFKAAGRQLPMRDLLLSAAHNLIDLGLNPKSTLEKLVKYSRQRWQRNGQTQTLGKLK